MKETELAPQRLRAAFVRGVGRLPSLGLICRCVEATSAKRWIELLSIRVAFIAVLALTSHAAAAQFDCTQVTVQNCPSLFKEECKIREFQSANVDACFDALTEVATDQPFCIDPAIGTCKPSEECTSLEDPVKRHFCAAGQSECKTSVPGLLSDYNVVLAGLEQSLGEYNELTSLNLQDATSIEALCEYQIEQLNALRSQAETELSTFQSSEDSIGQIDQCSSTMQSFLDAGAPPDLPQELWDQIAKVLDNGMAQIQSKQGEIQSKIEALRSAPDKLRSLQVAYGLICPAETGAHEIEGQNTSEGEVGQ